MEEFYDEEYKKTISPIEWADKQFNEVYHRNWKLYLNSIEWDTWCEPEDEQTIRERIKKHELETHPFRDFF